VVRGTVPERFRVTVDTADHSSEVVAFRPSLSKVFHFIEVTYHQPITLGNVLRTVGYSSAYLTDLVRRQTGQTVHQWIVKRRMQWRTPALRDQPSRK